MPNTSYDIFISYSRDDADWVIALAENLYNLGHEVFLDVWRIAPGDVLVHAIDAAIRDSRYGIIVISPSALAKPWVQEEYAAMMTRAVENKLRLIPVLLKEAELPPLLASRIWVDFRQADGDVYFAKVRELSGLLNDKRPGPPHRTGALRLPPGTGVRPEGPMPPLTLRVTPARVTLLVGNAIIAQAEPAGSRGDLEHELREVHQARRARVTPVREQAPGAGTAALLLHAASLRLGRRLGELFLPGAVGERLAEEIGHATGQGASQPLILDVHEELADLPWEGLIIPNEMTPLVLHPRVLPHRRPSGLGPTPGMHIPPPLRILAVIGSPDDQTTGNLLDMEQELSRILDGVDDLRREGLVHVRILENGTLALIREELARVRYHVLYISCHAAPGVLLLEKEDGNEEPVTAENLWQTIPADRGVPLVILAGCSTALDGEGNLPSLAVTLLEKGAPAVIAMQAPVGDYYASLLAEKLFRALSGHQHPDPLTALATARREVEHERLNNARPGLDLAEWLTPVLFLRGQAQPLLDWQLPREAIPAPTPPVFDLGVAVRGVGDFVGRRREQRQLLRALRVNPGVVIHGIGGVGKSTLAAHLLERLHTEGELIASCYGKVTPERILEELGERLISALPKPEDLPPDHPSHTLRQQALLLRQREVDWQERLKRAQKQLFPQLPFFFLLDNFEDNFHDATDVRQGLTSSALAAFLAQWLQHAGEGHLLITCRQRFTLPDHAEDGLHFFHLGPLYWPEVRKLVWRLPGLDRLSPEELRKAYENVGGHPRALEYLDALLRGGVAAYPDVTLKLFAALRRAGVDNPQAWCAEQAGKIDRALSETITLAASDVLLDALLALLDANTHALLLGASVYRQPVDAVGLWWQVGEEGETRETPELLKQLNTKIEAAQMAGESPALKDLVSSPQEMLAVRQALQENRTPPVTPPPWLETARERLLALGLLARGGEGADAPYRVHRWTAAALAQRADGATLRHAHHRAARYWRWRVAKLPQSPQQDMEELLEARGHHLLAGEREEATKMTYTVGKQFQTWGEWRRQEELYQEAIAWWPEESEQTDMLLHQLGNSAWLRDDHTRAEEFYQRALALAEQRGNRRLMANPLGQLSMVAEFRGDYAQAEDYGRRALAIMQEMDDRQGMAKSLHQLGDLARKQDRLAEAEEHYCYSLTIKEELGNRQGMAITLHGLGMVAQQRQQYPQAMALYRQSLAIKQELNNRQGMAKSLHQMGTAAQEQNDLPQAEAHYRRALAIFEELGDRLGMARSFTNLGALRLAQGQLEQALSYLLQALSLDLQVKSPEKDDDLHNLNHLRDRMGAERFRTMAARYWEGDMDELLGLMDRVKAGA